MFQEQAAYKQPMTERLDRIEQRWRANPIMAAESYPDDCWTFDHAVALAAFKVADRLDGTDHSELCKRWIATAKEKLVHKKTGLLNRRASGLVIPKQAPAVPTQEVMNSKA
jgi:hypothetical protein